MKSRKDKINYLKKVKENGTPPKFMILMETTVNGKKMLQGDGEYYEMDHKFGEGVHVIKFTIIGDDDDQSDKD